jgi:hypothetical protein
MGDSRGVEAGEVPVGHLVEGPVRDHRAAVEHDCPAAEAAEGEVVVTRGQDDPAIIPVSGRRLAPNATDSVIAEATGISIVGNDIFAMIERRISTALRPLMTVIISS